MIEAILGLVSASLAAMLYFVYRLGKLEGIVKLTDHRLNHIEHQLEQLIKGKGE